MSISYHLAWQAKHGGQADFSRVSSSVLHVRDGHATYLWRPATYWYTGICHPVTPLESLQLPAPSSRISLAWSWALASLWLSEHGKGRRMEQGMGCGAGEEGRADYSPEV